LHSWRSQLLFPRCHHGRRSFHVSHTRHLIFSIVIHQQQTPSPPRGNMENRGARAWGCQSRAAGAQALPELFPSSLPSSRGASSDWSLRGNESHVFPAALRLARPQLPFQELHDPLRTSQTTTQLVEGERSTQTASLVVRTGNDPSLPLLQPHAQLSVSCRRLFIVWATCFSTLFQFTAPLKYAAGVLKEKENNALVPTIALSET
jgi:hypothetical protein